MCPRPLLGEVVSPRLHVGAENPGGPRPGLGRVVGEEVLLLAGPVTHRQGAYEIEPDPRQGFLEIGFEVLEPDYVIHLSVGRS